MTFIKNKVIGVMDNIYKITLKDKDLNGFQKNVDFIFDVEKFKSLISEDRNGINSQDFYIELLIESIEKEFKRKYNIN